MKRYLLMLLITLAAILNNLNAQTFRLHENGVTVVCDGAQPGDTGVLFGEIFTAVSEIQLRQMVSNGDDVSKVCTSLITDMNSLFRYRHTFNYDISTWDVSNVTDMSLMFNLASTFNNDISNWDVSNVTNMSSVFSSASAFNGDISHWDVSNVTSMSSMFSSSAFNGDISDWDVSSVSDLGWMFANTEAFNGDISRWDVSNVTNMKGMFSSSAFNGDISKWNVSNVTNMSEMFDEARAFNSDISKWNVSNVTSMEKMFYVASAFDQNISSWCVDKISFEPTQFSLNSSLIPQNAPMWGMCPGKPSIIQLSEPVNNISEVLLSNVTLSWGMDQDAITYQLFVFEGTSITIIDTTLNTTSYTITDSLKGSTQYFWRVRGINDSKIGEFSSIWNFSTRQANVSNVSLHTPAKASKLDNNNPILVWNTELNADSYQVQVSTNSFSSTSINQFISDTTLALSNLEFNTSYQWRVKAINSVSESDWSQPWSFTTRVGDVAGVVLFDPKNDSSLVPINPSFKWSSEPNVSTYQLQLSTDSFASISNDQELADTTFTTSNLSYSTTYQWRVRAKNAYSTSEWSTPRTFTTRQADVSTTTLASPENNVTTNTIEPTLSWLRAANADSFRVQLSSDQFSTIIVDSSLIDTTISTPSLAYNTIYQWRVKAKNTVSESDWSQPWSFTTRLPDVTGVSIISPKIDSMDAPLDVQLVWSSDSNATAYELEYYGGINTKSTNGEHHEVKNSVFISDTTFTPTDLINEAYVTWKVRALNDYSVSEWSTGRFSVRPANTGNISLLSPENNETTDTIYPDLYFSRDRSADWYRIQVTTDTFENTLIDTLYSLFYESVMTFIPSTLTYNTTYKWRVKAVNSVSESDWTEPWSFTTRVADVTIVSLNSPTNNEVLDLIAPIFVWNKEMNASSYQLEVSSDNFTSTIISETLSDTTFSGVNLENGKVYQWRVKAINAYSESEWTTYSFEIPVTTSIRNEDLPTKTELLPNYPNPFNPSTQIRFSLAESSLTTLEVYSIDGTKVASLVNQVLNAGWHTATFNAANLPTGLYLYRLNTGKQQITKKMLLVK